MATPTATPKNETAAPANDEVVSLTDWNQFVKAGLTPTQIICQEYRPIHPTVVGCHSRLLTRRPDPDGKINPKTSRPLLVGSAQSMLDHVKADHGGGFAMTFKRDTSVDKSVWAGWAELKASGVEITDLRCEWCEKAEDRVHAGSILSHFKPHKGRGRGLKPAEFFWLTLSFATSNGHNDEDDEE